MHSCIQPSGNHKTLSQLLTQTRRKADPALGVEVVAVLTCQHTIAPPPAIFIPCAPLLTTSHHFYILIILVHLVKSKGFLGMAKISADIADGYGDVFSIKTRAEHSIGALSKPSRKGAGGSDGQQKCGGQNAG